MQKTSVILVLVIFGLLGMRFGFVFCGASVNSTYVGGRITEDTTWNLAESPFVILADCFVDSGTTLTIEPGVVVKFDTDLSLTVSGSLHAMGTKTNPVIFTSNKPQPAAGDWYTVRFAPEGYESSAMEYCVVEYAVNGITVNTVARITVEGSHFLYNSHSGMHVGGPSNVLLRGSSLMFNGQHGVSITGLSNSGITLIDNNLSFNSGTGINLLTESDAHVRGYASNLTFSRNLVSFNRKNGIRLYKYVSVDAVVENVAISNNNISFNGEEGLQIFSSGEIFDARISGNNVSYNGGNGINLEISSFSPNSEIYDSNISSNIVSFNSGSGIFLHIVGTGYGGAIHGVTVLDNTVLSNMDGISLFARKHCEEVLFDTLIQGNSLSANSQCGIWLLGNVKTNITTNSISYNWCGVSYEESTDNVANLNDIYCNSQGMKVSEGATVDAELNYWGAASGPYHDSRNSEGNGNPVNGNGTDLDFEPFLYTPIGRINGRPVARLLLDRNVATVNGTVTFEGTKSSDDGRVCKYLFDFGDGFKSEWTTSSMVRHSYTHVGIYNASLVVMDECAVTSENLEMEVVNIVEQLPSLTVFLDADPSTVRPGESLIITVHVTHGKSSVGNATVSLSSDKGGAFSPETGCTEPNGTFTCTFTAPSTIGRTECVIAVNVTKTGFLDGQNQIKVIIVEEGGLDLWSFLVSNGWKLVGIGAAILVSLFLIMRARKAKQGSSIDACTHRAIVIVMGLTFLLWVGWFPLSEQKG